jgi:hypothetical protein
MASTRFPTSPGFFGILFGASLSIFAGALLAAAHLVAKPVEVLTVEPKEREPGVVYFVSGVKGGDWERKVAMLSNPGATVRFSEGELNGWAERLFEQQLLKTKSDGTTESEAALKDAARSLNLRLVGEELQIGLVRERAIGPTGSKLVVQMRGGFAKGAFGWGYNPEVGYVGALPLHKIPGALALARTYFPKWVPELTKADSVGVGEGVFVVRMP